MKKIIDKLTWFDVVMVAFDVLKMMSFTMLIIISVIQGVINDPSLIEMAKPAVNNVVFFTLVILLLFSVMAERMLEKIKEAL